MNRFHKTRRVPTRLLSILLLALLASIPAQAALLGLDGLLEPYPDLKSDFLNVTYTNSTSMFEAVGTTSAYDPDSVTDYIVTDGGFNPGSCTLTAQIDGSGNLLSGTISISGAVVDQDFNELIPFGVLLQGTLTQFGFLDGGAQPDKFDFLFDVTGGSLAGDYGSVAGTILGMQSTSFVNFSGNFSNSGIGVADTRMMVVPEPSTWLLVSFSVLALGWFVRRAPLCKS